MIGAIIGDIVGSKYEFNNIKTKDFPFLSKECTFTDDTVMTCAVAKSIMEHFEGKGELGRLTVKNMQAYGRLYPHRGYGGMFGTWIYDDNPKPYGSWGNGAPMRVSPCGFIARSLEEAERLAYDVTVTTHNSDQAVFWSVMVAKLIWLLYHGGVEKDKAIGMVDPDNILDTFTLDSVRKLYKFDVSCVGTVPYAIRAFKESTSFEDAIRNAISIGGDSDTIAAITGPLAEAYYGVKFGMAITFLRKICPYSLPPIARKTLIQTVLDFYYLVPEMNPVGSSDTKNVCGSKICAVFKHIQG